VTPRVPLLLAGQQVGWATVDGKHVTLHVEEESVVEAMSQPVDVSLQPPLFHLGSQGLDSRRDAPASPDQTDSESS
jgi:hypothetical protein